MSDQTHEKHNDEKDVKLKLAGVGYTLGDAAMVAAGVLRKEVQADGSIKRESFTNSATSALVWLAGGIAAAVFGNPGPEMQLKIQANRLQRHLKDKGIVIPDDVKARAELFRDNGLWDNAQEFLFEHPSELLNASYAVGAANLLWGGCKEIFEKKTHGFLPRGKNALPMSDNAWIGGIILTGALIGLFVKEDKDAQKKAENKGPLEKAVAFVTEKPLRVTAALYGANNLFLAHKAWGDFKKRDELYTGETLKPHFFSGAQLMMYLFSNTMLFLSPRDQVNKKTFDENGLTRLQEAAAEIIAAQPQEIRESLVKDMSEFMSKQAGITQKPEEIELQMKKELHAVTTKTPAERRFAVREAARDAQRAAEAQSKVL